MKQRKPARRGAPRGQRWATTLMHTEILKRIQKWESQAAVARAISRGPWDQAASKQRVHRAIQDGIEIPNDPELIIELIQRSTDAEP